MELIYESSDLQGEFSSGELTRARGIRRDDKILAVESNDDGSLIVGRVRGSSGEKYRQIIRSRARKGELEIQGSCSCPVGFNCKHVAALMLEVQARNDTPARVRPLSKPEDVILQELDDLLDDDWDDDLDNENVPTITVNAKSSPITDPVQVEYERLKRDLTNSRLSDQTLMDAARAIVRMNLERPVSNAQTAVKLEPKATPVAPPLTPELQRWLEQSERELQLARLIAEPARPNKTRELLFMLSPARYSHRMVIELKTGQPRAAGGWGDLKNSSVQEELSSAPQYVQKDLDVLRMLMACSSKDFGSIGNPRILEDSGLIPTLLERLAGTGRLIWQGRLEKPLRIGPARPANAVWTIEASGLQRPRLETDPPVTATLALAHPWYVDAERGEIGPLTLTLEPALVKTFLGAPSVQPGSLEAFRHEFLARFPNLPAPHALEVRTQDTPPVPVLRLSSTTIPSQSWNRPPEPIETAALEFAYGSRRVANNAADMRLTEFRDGVIYATDRFPKLERGFEKTLLGYGWVPMDAVLAHYRIPPDRKGHWTLGEKGKFGTRETWLEFMETQAPKLREAGWLIEFEAGFRYNLASIEDWYGALEEDGGWFGLELGVVVDGQRVSLIPLLIALIREHSTLLSSANIQALPDEHTFYPRLPDGRLIALPAQRVRGILGVLVELYLSDRLGDGKIRLPMLDAARLLALEEALRLRWFGGKKLLQLGRKLRDFAGIKPVAPPDGLALELRPYQIQGVSWLQFLREHDLGGILADDMGLGKTPQTLAHLLAEKIAGRAQKPSLVIAPTSLMTNWRLEAEKFTPELKVLVLHGEDRSQDFKRIMDHDLVLTTYPLVLRDLKHLEKYQYHLLVLDEAQHIKNARSGAAQAVSGLKANHRLCLTGTPLENHLGELWSLFHFLMPGFLGDEKHFRELYRTPIERHGDNTRRHALAARVKPFILRREKALVARELPLKTEIIERVELEGAQRDLYETLRTSMSERVREEIERHGLARSQIMILDALLKLRQTCLDPRLVKLDAAKKAKHSAKLDWFLETLPNMLEEGRSVLVFSAFSSMLELLEPELEGRDIAYSKLTGDTKDRPAQINAFQDGETRVFLISLKAGGVGLNLTAADTVIHLDPWWNPAAENQATDRAHRIGQTKPVFVYKLVAQGSLEERILQLQTRKAELARGILEGSLGESTALTQRDLDYLLAPLEVEAE